VTRPDDGALASDITVFIKTSPASQHVERNNHPYLHDHRQNRKKPPITTMYEAEEEEETATIMGFS
jgi:hypothetical protein